MEKQNKHQIPTLFLALQFTFVTFGPLIGLMVLGKFADDYFKTFPVFLIISIILGVTISFYEMWKMMKSVMRR